MNAYPTVAVGAHVAPAAADADLSLSYGQYFTPNDQALTGDQPFAAFEIYSAVNYSIPVTLSSGSLLGAGALYAALESDR